MTMIFPAQCSPENLKTKQNTFRRSKCGKMYACRRVHLEIGLPMGNMMSKIGELLKDTNSLIEFEKQIQLLRPLTCVSNL